MLGTGGEGGDWFNNALKIEGEAQLVGGTKSEELRNAGGVAKVAAWNVESISYSSNGVLDTYAVDSALNKARVFIAKGDRGGGGGYTDHGDGVFFNEESGGENWSIRRGGGLGGRDDTGGR